MNSCRICGRQLSNPESIQRGIGPTCFSRLPGIQRRHIMEIKFPEKPEIEFCSNCGGLTESNDRIKTIERCVCK